MPMESRRRADYARVMDSFRAIYHDNPGDVHAAASVYAVAELLAEQGRGLHDTKSLKAAVGQYEFLRTQYPGSSLRIAALLAEAEIEENDLRDDAAARERYKLLLKQYPRSEQAEEARAGLDSIATGRARMAANLAAAEPAPIPAVATPMPAVVAPVATAPVTEARPDATAGRSIDEQDAAIASPLDVGVIPASAHKKSEPASAHKSGRLAQVKGIRHWSTPTYTRVAIDLGDDVTFEAARVPNPDRIYFDLHGTRLTPELVGKSFSVTDDGFLKKIRAAQFSDNMTRIVLDVNDVSEYSAFLLPNPYRLIIDIHGGADRNGRATTTGVASATVAQARPDPMTAGAGQAAGQVTTPNPGQSAGQSAGPSTGPSILPSMAPTSAPTSATTSPAISGLPLTPVSAKAQSTVPNTVAVRATSSTDVAALSAQPGRVDATTRPTSQPISAVVAGREPAREQAGGASTTSTTRRKTKSTAADGAAVGWTEGGALPARAAMPTADGETSLVRALGLKIGRIVIDAGHGGHDSGTLGVDGIEEKDVVLDVALRLGKLLHERLGAEIIYTRSDDTFIPLETRTAIANKAQADLFLSIHANSSPDESARGVEAYYLNFTSSPDALQTAARENAVSNQSIHQLSDLVKKIALRDKIDESREFATDVEQGLYTGLAKGNEGLKNRGVKKAPFVVLIGANMPSVLAEISFVTNPRDAEQLRRPEYRQRVAESLYKGVAKYEAGLSGVKSPTLRASAGTK
jgi:N-acetylmuramoyl-L-alanine amidase